MMHAGASVFGVDHSILGQPWRWRAVPGAGAAIAQAHGLSDAVGLVMAGRGAAPETAARLLKPTLRDWLPDPSLFKDMDRAAERLVTAIRGGEAIVIFGDYDVDGATSTALLWRLLRHVGATVSFYIPDRMTEGYGPSVPAMRALAEAGAKVVVTVDCGTQAFEALAAAAEAGLDVLVVDHHKAGWELPACHALVNPNRLDDDAGPEFGHMAAVGVAFLLAIAVNRLLRDSGWYASGRDAPDLMTLLDLVALGTVADVAPLTGINRAFVAQGLKVMARRDNLGLATLGDVARMERAPEAGDLGFQLGPRINAGGRVGRSDLGTRLLISSDPLEARTLAEELDRLNGERKALEALTTEQALAVAPAADPVVVAVGEGWHPGVIGIVAGRLKERFGRPAVVIATEGGIGKGSGRSVPGVDLGAAVLAAKDEGLLVAGGGHAMAAGLTIAADRVEALRDFLSTRLGEAVARAADGRALKLDAALAPGGVTAQLGEELAAAGPYGQGWPAPKLAVGPVSVVKCDVVGQDHVRLILAGRDGARIKAMAFRHADTPLGQAFAGAGRRPLYVAGRLVIDSWSGEPRPELHLDDAAWAD
ncbi:single-stranded-DNA-specific exonuclease RecJ [Parapedomonas caeni]